jgi:hypothetical protein
MKNPASLLRTFLLFGLATFLLAGCAETKLSSSWTAPGVTSLKFRKVIIIGLGANREFNRRMAESAVKNQLTKIEAVPSYELLPGLTDIKDRDAVLKMISDSGADGVITLRLAGSSSRVHHGASDNLPMDYMTISGYFGAVYDVAGYYLSDGGRDIVQDRVLAIETNIYDARTGKLLWSGLTVSTQDASNPGSVPHLIAEVGKVIRAKLESEGLIR